MELISIFANELTKCLKGILPVSNVTKLIEKPRHTNQGDIAFPCFTLAKIAKKSPNQIAIELANNVKHPLFAKVVADGPYVNGFFNKKIISKEVIHSILQQGEKYGSTQIGNGENITIDFSSPNIAKPFSMGHLRSTVIGNSLAHIVEKCGYKAIRINHLGDWGTQFGKLIVAYKKWGNEQSVQQNPIKELLDLYVKFHKEAESHSHLEAEARMWFKKLEDGDKEAKTLWKWFRKESLQEFSKIYSLLGIEFDTYHGEAFYNDKMEETINVLKNQEILSYSDGAEVVNLEEFDLPPCLIKKTDGATLYATRDLTAALYRQETYHFSKGLYVVGHEQSLHFKQVFLVLEKLGYSWAKELVHVPFGFILKDGKKMSTRKGEIVLLEEVINDAIILANQNIEAKNPTLEHKEEVAKNVAIGSLIFHDLKNERLNNIEFSLEEMLKFEGETGPYVQYTHARACSILRKVKETNDLQAEGLEGEESWALVKHLMEFPTVIKKSLTLYEPSQIAKYLIDLSQEFNKYYGLVKILAEDNQKQNRVALVKTVTIVLSEGLRLLGIKAPEEM
ncbi:arginine--tRNA ligase [Metabacillus litoralis]|uniref:Arginine--tRNA ligase n=1 Tax=Metabacillus litoralis TaxID=152268 RepID=A0A179T625_9BACI|nr:arginine--tRNA ligase [Metabacillus litoralis]OAS89447.1 arginine--tRNA ligase [Metabacillus litoralis]